MKKVVFLIFSLFQLSSSIAQQKVVLIEQFSNSGCPTCAAFTPPIVNWVQGNNAKACMLVYHTPFPYNDSMYHENPTESDARVAFYNVVGVPHSILDGNYYRANSSTFGSNISTQVNNRLGDTSRYDLVLQQASLLGNTVSGVLELQTTNLEFEPNINAFIVAVEEELLKSAYAASPGNNSENVYHFVMRKFLTPIEGVVLSTTPNSNSKTIAFNWELTNFKRSSELRLLAFVQNTQTKEILNARYWNPTQPVGLFSKKATELQLFPNPSSSSSYFHMPIGGDFLLELSNLSGQVIYSSAGEAAVYDRLEIPQLPQGVYVVKLSAKQRLFYSKLIQQ
ncbi:MAG: T9SS type A sorting domain-containing protein [Bacteroidia bacterium]|nr:T9SS type A sorting domain-containing protein [Bacteroidia bacterium]